MTAKLFLDHLGGVRSAVDAELRACLAAQRDHANALSSVLLPTVEAVASLTLRGGKRFRAGLVEVTYEACGGSVLDPSAIRVGAALELLQTYFLIHDDWMDQDEVRRGGPSVHVTLGRAHGSQRAGDTAAILAGDWCAALAQDLMAHVERPPAVVAGLVKELARIQRDVVWGQMLDTLGVVGDRAEGEPAGGEADESGTPPWSGDPQVDIEVVHRLKTGAYTVEGPVRLGAILAGASASQWEALTQFTVPLGVAFQLRDDLLGAFGDPTETGKPVGNDLAEGKRTAVTVAAWKVPECRQALRRYMAHHRRRTASTEASPSRSGETEELASLLALLEAAGVRRAIETRVIQLMQESRKALEGAPLSDHGKALLESAASALGERSR